MSIEKYKIPSPLSIGLLDTGLAPIDPSFKDHIQKSVSFDQNGNLINEAPTSSPNCHSILISKIIFGDRYYQLSPLSSQAKLVSVTVPTRGKILLNLLKGMDFLISMNPKIVCMPIGIKKQTPIFYPMIQTFLKKGILSILPIGNGGPGNALVPGCYPGLLSAGAVNTNGEATNYSGSYLDESGNCLKPDILAPGTSISINGERIQNGTSFACAFVAGVAARLLQKQPNAGCEAIKEALYSTASTLTSKLRGRCRRGSIQPDAALKYLLGIEMPSTTPTKDHIPSFLQNPYQDSRFLFQLKYATSEQLLEAIIIPSGYMDFDVNSQLHSPLSRKLLSHIRENSRTKEESCHYFKHADMAYVRANTDFFNSMLSHSGLFAISAVDVNFFEM